VKSTAGGRWSRFPDPACDSRALPYKRGQSSAGRRSERGLLRTAPETVTCSDSRRSLRGPRVTHHGRASWPGGPPPRRSPRAEVGPRRT
jgi:hypothetical protein